MGAPRATSHSAAAGGTAAASGNSGDGQVNAVEKRRATWSLEWTGQMRAARYDAKRPATRAGNRGLIVKTFLVLWAIILVYGFISR